MHVPSLQADFDRMEALNGHVPNSIPILEKMPAILPTINRQTEASIGHGTLVLPFTGQDQACAKGATCLHVKADAVENCYINDLGTQLKVIQGSSMTATENL